MGQERTSVLRAIVSPLVSNVICCLIDVSGYESCECEDMKLALFKREEIIVI